ncbi:MAG: hypothetical protein OEP45_14110, partial [Acidobacteriota bacterium]|nr:hypothetical protein [Acidobacteriota bacterium]
TAASTCGGIVVAPEGGSTITFSDGTVAENSSCSITVDVEGNFTGEGIVNETLTNVSGELTSSAGNSGSATADLVIAADLPGFSKAFSPSTVPLGGRSTLTFTIDNSANPEAEYFLTFTDSLPAGMVVAGPANAVDACSGADGVLGAVPGTSVITFNSGFLQPLAGGESCTVSVDVVAAGGGDLGNTSGELSSTDDLVNFLFAGKASAILAVDFDVLNLIKSFTDDPVPPEATVTLEFTINNFSREDSATGITFTDDLEAVISGLVALGLPASDVCGAGSTLSGTSVITLTGGNLPPEGSCTFSVTLQLPAGSVAGVFPNTTSAVSGDVGGSPTTGNAASDLLFVEPGPALTKEFTDDPVGGGGTVNLEFTIVNTSPTSAATDIAFADVLDDILVDATVPAPGFCGPGATMVFTPNTGFDPARLDLTGAELAVGAQCTFSVDLDVIAGAPGGFYPNVTSPVTATVDAVTATGPPASDDLEVLGAPAIQKEFIGDPADPGDIVGLEFTITHDVEAPTDATDITFTDDLDAALAGLEAIGLPVPDVCGAGSTLSGTSTLTLTGGTLAPGESCLFSAALTVPADAPAGPHTNTTSVVSATVGGTTVMGVAASDDLMISGLEFTKEFLDDPVIPGDAVTLRFTIDNISPVSDATAITFTDSLSAVLPGLVSTSGTLSDVCGTGSQITGTSNLVFTGGNLLAATSCTFDVTLAVPGGADDGTYVNVTSNITATMEGGPLAFDPAADSLEVSSSFLGLEKEFTDDPVAPGDNVTLEFTVTNLDPARAATAITFTDDLDDALPGLVAVGLPADDVCGAGSQVSGTDFLTLTGGNLAAGASCTFSLTLQVPGSVGLGTIAINVTSSVSGTIDGLAVAGDPATAELLIDFFSFSKAFDGPTVAGGTVDLTFSIVNESASEVSGIGFSDDLDAVVAGLEAVGLPASDVCGAGSQIAGTGFLTMTGGTLLPGASCSIVVTLQVPAGAAAGTFTNTTSDLLENGLPAANPAVADLTIEPPPTFAKAFAPDVINQFDVSVLTFTIDNSASSFDATALDFTDTMPAAIVVATPANESTTCVGGVITAVPGTNVISYTGGSVGAGASCTVEVDVTSFTVGIFTNTTDELTSSNGNSGTATDDLEVFDTRPPRVAAVDTVQGTGDGQLEECETAHSRISQFLVTFDEAMFDPGNSSDPNSVTNPDNWFLVGAGDDRDITTTLCGAAADDDQEVAIGTVTYDGGTFTATVDVAGPLLDAPYRLFACSGGLADAVLNALDGDGDGTGGDDFVRNFRVDEADAFANGNFDCSLDGWTASTDGTPSIFFSTVDVDDASISGSA